MKILKLCNIFLLSVRKDYRYGMHWVYVYMRYEFDICNIIFGEYPLNGENKALNCIILYT